MLILGGGSTSCWPLRALWPDLGLIQVHKQRVQIQRVRQNVHPVTSEHPSDLARPYLTQKAPSSNYACT